MASTTLTLIKGLYGYTLTFSITDAAGTASVHLTGYAVKFKVWRAGTPGELLLNGTCTINTPDTSCSYLVTATDFLSVGDFLGQIRWTVSGLDDGTDTFKVIVKEAP